MVVVVAGARTRSGREVRLGKGCRWKWKSHDRRKTNPSPQYVQYSRMNRNESSKAVTLLYCTSFSLGVPPVVQYSCNVDCYYGQLSTGYILIHYPLCILGSSCRSIPWVPLWSCNVDDIGGSVHDYDGSNAIFMESYIALGYYVMRL
jgi:hypothetical protein